MITPERCLWGRRGLCVAAPAGPGLHRPGRAARAAAAVVPEYRRPHGPRLDHGLLGRFQAPVHGRFGQGGARLAAARSPGRRRATRPRQAGADGPPLGRGADAPLEHRPRTTGQHLCDGDFAPRRASWPWAATALAARWETSPCWTPPGPTVVQVREEHRETVMSLGLLGIGGGVGLDGPQRAAAAVAGRGRQAANALRVGRGDPRPGGCPGDRRQSAIAPDRGRRRSVGGRPGLCRPVARREVDDLAGPVVRRRRPARQHAEDRRTTGPSPPWPARPTADTWPPRIKPGSSWCGTCRPAAPSGCRRRCP